MFHDANIAYTQAYLGVLYDINPHTLILIDESGFQLPQTSNPTYGHIQFDRDVYKLVEILSSLTLLSSSWLALQVCKKSQVCHL